MTIYDNEFSAWMLQAIAVDGIARIGNDEFLFENGIGTNDAYHFFLCSLITYIVRWRWSKTAFYLFEIIGVGFSFLETDDVGVLINEIAHQFVLLFHTSAKKEGVVAHHFDLVGSSSGGFIVDEGMDGTIGVDVLCANAQSYQTEQPRFARHKEQSYDPKEERAEEKNRKC